MTDFGFVQFLDGLCVGSPDSSVVRAIRLVNERSPVTARVYFSSALLQYLNDILLDKTHYGKDRIVKDNSIDTSFCLTLDVFFIKKGIFLYTCM